MTRTRFKRRMRRRLAAEMGARAAPGPAGDPEESPVVPDAEPEALRRPYLPFELAEEMKVESPTDETERPATEDQAGMAEARVDDDL